jgi:hypothetical protein
MLDLSTSDLIALQSCTGEELCWLYIFVYNKYVSRTVKYAFQKRSFTLAFSFTFIAIKYPIADLQFFSHSTGSRLQVSFNSGIRFIK